MGDASNPFLEPSTLPYGLPLFALLRPEHYRDAIVQGMHEQRAEVEAIADDPAPPSFDNTIVALERSGELLRRVLPVFENASSADTDEAIDALDAELAPLLAAHHDAIRLDPRLFARIGLLHGMREELGLDPDQAYLLERVHREAVLAGAALDPEARERLAALNAELSTLTTAFQQHLLADTNDLALHLVDESELAGLDAGARSTAREAARTRGLDGWLLTLVLPTGQPALAALARSDVRDRLLEASRSRGCRGAEHDTRQILLDIVRLRAERARLLGFPNHAAAVTAGETSGSPEAVTGLLAELTAPAMRNVARERDVLASRASAIGAREPVAADWSFLAEQVRAEQHDLDLAELRPYLELDRVLVDGVFHAAHLLYGLRFTARADLVGYHPDTRVFEVFEEDGMPVGLYLFDPYTRDSKRGGAWMSALVSQSELTGDLAVVVNNMNIPKPAAGEPTLLTFDEAETLFHEFGHALHGLLARVRYPSQAGTNVYRDFVELPSQVNELWLLRPEVVERFAVHHETGERMPQQVVDRLTAARGFNAGFDLVEYLAAAALDQAWHRIGAGDRVADVAAFERSSLVASGLDDPLVPPRYSTTYFAHVFAGGYDAGYYSYIWSEVPGADIMEWFEQHGGATRANGARYRREILNPGGSRDPGESIRALLGRDPSIEPLLRRRGLA
ncbi:peptidyl-dipeptidase Dcp [Agromyces sp. 3263]|uniref:M3 family metallopeptidase n=1 Tax=Agromyces sp. 3263 TaxID=2817750 RepID=UPI00285B7747|nr:M3 family metallopeptidase [Agromyces sp. 3263]MDR6907327.1 peptidyl-dipeptidase Dcp [Agromyces sp. 3263]